MINLSTKLRKHALLVGINKYKYYPEYKLYGCVNDVKNLKRFLIEYLNFKDSEITVLTDEKATKMNILREASNLVFRGHEGLLDYIFISNSSHGSQQPTGSLEEPDGLDEIYCPHDIQESNGIWDKNSVIVDDEWYALLSQLPKEVIVEFLSDACHSGDSLRAANLFNIGAVPVRNRFIPPPFMLGYGEFDIKLFDMTATHNPPLQNVILWSGCKSDQTSADAFINHSYQGAFTCFFLKNYQHSKFRNEIIQDINDDLDKNKYEQDPQLECSDELGIKPIGSI
jgi:metacaspase-1